MCVCLSEKEREREREKKKERVREKERERDVVAIEGLEYGSGRSVVGGIGCSH